MESKTNEKIDLEVLKLLHSKKLQYDTLVTTCSNLELEIAVKKLIPSLKIFSVIDSRDKYISLIKKAEENNILLYYGNLKQFFDLKSVNNCITFIRFNHKKILNSIINLQSCTTEKIILLNKEYLYLFNDFDTIYLDSKNVLVWN